MKKRTTKETYCISSIMSIVVKLDKLPESIYITSFVINFHPHV